MIRVDLSNIVTIGAAGFLGYFLALGAYQFMTNGFSSSSAKTS